LGTPLENDFNNEYSESILINYLSKNANLEDAILLVSESPNHILVNGCVHYWEDIQTELSKIFKDYDNKIKAKKDILKTMSEKHE
jgi:hypothetical protein